MQHTQLRFFFFYYLYFVGDKSFYGNKFVKHPTFPPLEEVEKKIREDATPEGEEDKINGVFFCNWIEMSMRDWMTATGQVPAKVQPAKAPLIKSLK